MDRCGGDGEVRRKEAAILGGCHGDLEADPRLRGLAGRYGTA